MGKNNVILVETEEQKKKVFELFDGFTSKTKILKYYKLNERKCNHLLLDEIASIIGFDFNVYKERKKKSKKYCLFCGKEIISKDTRKKFCNCSCAASFNNKLRNVNKKVNENRICPICGSKKYNISLKCQKCENNKKKESLLSRTLGDFIVNKKYLSQQCGTIRRNGRIIIASSSIEKVCSYCKNHDYDEILEVHHIKGILQFDNSSTVREINSIENLIWLCPNHHAMVEKGLIIL